MKKAIKSRLTACVLLLAVICLRTVVAEDVIVKEGRIGTGSVSPDSRAKVFISDGADDISYEDCYGLLTIATDSTYGTDNNYGTMCEFFPNATSSGEGAGYGKLAGGFFNYPVREESASDRIYYGLYSLTCPWSGYSTAGNNVYMVGTGTSVTNPTSVSGGYYTTTGLSVFAQPVESGCTMGGALSFKNYGIEVGAMLYGDYQATSGTGENFGVKITTVEALDAIADESITSYALYLDAFTSSAKLGGGETYGIYQKGSGVMNYFEGNISAAQVIDRTPAYEGTAQDALSEIVNTKAVDGRIDHASLPALVRATVKRVEKTNHRIVEYTDPAGKVREREQYDINIVEEEGRSLGGMITVLTEAVKGLNEKIEALQAENQTLKAEIASLKGQ